MLFPIRPITRRLQSPKVLIILAVLQIILVLAGGSAGRLVALCLAARWFVFPDREIPWRPAGDALQALAAGLLLALLCHLVWAPDVLLFGDTTSHDVGEIFDLLHSLGEPGWPDWSPNRYPLPVLLARLIGGGGTPHACYAQAAIVSMVFIGAGIFLWGRAVVNRGAGWAAVLIVGVFPELVIICRTVSTYPEVIALWALSAGLSAYAVRFPSLVTCGLAGLGVAFAFCSDSRGLFLGLITFGLSLVAVMSTKGWRRRAIAGVLVLTPVLLSWWAYHEFPNRLRSLEEMLEASVEASYTRYGQQPPPRRYVRNEQGYCWGVSGPLDLPLTVANLFEARSRMNSSPTPASAPQATIEGGDQGNPPQIHHYPGEGNEEYSILNPHPYVPSILVLVLATFLVGGGVPGRKRLKDPRAWRTWLDWRGRIGLLPLVAYLIILATVYTYDNTARYAAMGLPALVLLAGTGMVAIGGRRAPSILYVGLVALILYAIPGPLNVDSPIHAARAMPEVKLCLDLANGAQVELPSNLGQRGSALRCAEAQSRQLSPSIAWPFHESGEKSLDYNGGSIPGSSPLP